MTTSVILVAIFALLLASTMLFWSAKQYVGAFGWSKLYASVIIMAIAGYGAAAYAVFTLITLTTR